MQKLRWPIAILILLIVIAGVFALRKEPNDLEKLRPYVVGDITYYIPQGMISIVPAPPRPSPAFSRRMIMVKGVGQDQLVSILKARANHLTWTPKVKTGSWLWFRAESVDPNSMDSICGLRTSRSARIS